MWLGKKVSDPTRLGGVWAGVSGVRGSGSKAPLNTWLAVASRFCSIPTEVTYQYWVVSSAPALAVAPELVDATTEELVEDVPVTLPGVLLAALAPESVATVSEI